MSCGVGRRLGSDPVLLWLWHRPITTVPIPPLTWEPPYASCVALKRKEKKKKKKKKDVGPKTPGQDDFIAPPWSPYTFAYAIWCLYPVLAFTFGLLDLGGGAVLTQFWHWCLALTWLPFETSGWLQSWRNLPTCPSMAPF